MSWIIGIVILALSGALPLIIEAVIDGRNAACEAGKMVLNETMKIAMLNQIWDVPPEDRKFLADIYYAGSVSYCEMDKFKRVLEIGKSK